MIETGPTRLRPARVVVLLIVALIAASACPVVAAQDMVDDSAGTRDVLLQAVLEDAANWPLELRVLRMTLQPGARSPWHAHPGLEFGVVESGVLSVQVDGPAVVRPADADPDVESQEVPINLGISLSEGDRIAYAPGTGMTFRNPGTEPTVLLAATVFPAGPGAPPSSVFPAGTPSPEDLDGVESVILGQAIVEDTEPGAVVVFERLEVEAGDHVPAFPGPVLMALEEGAVAGSVRAPGTGAAGDSTSSSSEEVEFSLARGDAAFFTSGMSDALLTGGGRIVLLRLGIVTVPATTPVADIDLAPAATDTVSASSPRGLSLSTIKIEATSGVTASTDVTPEPEPASDPTAVPAATAAAAPTAPPAPTPIPAPSEPTPEPDDEPAVEAEPPSADEPFGNVYPAVGSTLRVNDDEVRIREEPSLEGEVLAGLSAGQVVIVLGEPVAADGYIWYPVQDAADPTLTGWVAALFLDFTGAP